MSKKLDDRLEDYLEQLKWEKINNRVLSQFDRKTLIDDFRELLEQGIEYHIDDIRYWLYFRKEQNLLEDNVIEEIARIAEYVQIDFNPL